MERQSQDHGTALQDHDARHRIMLVDDHALFRDGLRLILRQNPGIDPNIQEAGSVTEAMSLLRNNPCPHVLLLDVVMPGIPGLDGLRLLRQACPQMRIAILSAIADIQMERDALARGADGFIPKTATAEEILPIIDRLLEGLFYFPSLGNLPPSPAPATVAQLTPRQLEVLALLAEGNSNKVIARQLGLSENTVRTHVGAVLDYFGVSTRMEAMFVARSQGVIA